MKGLLAVAALLSSLMIADTICAFGEAASCDNPVAEWGGTIGPAIGVNRIRTANGGALLVGDYGNGVDLDPTSGVHEPPTNGGLDAFVTMVHADGSYGWTYTAGGPANDHVSGVATGPDGSVVVVGGFVGTVDFDPGWRADERTSVGDGYNPFIVRLSPDGKYDSVITFGQGSRSAGADAVATGESGALYVLGSFLGTGDFDPSDGEDLRIAQGRDVFLTKLEQDGTYAWTRTIGGPAFDSAAGIGLDAAGDILITGTFRGTVDFDPTDGVDIHHMVAPYEDAFITKLHPDGSYAWTRTYDAGGSNAVDGIAVSLEDGSAVIGGGFRGTIDFDTTNEGSDVRTSLTEYSDLYVTKVNADGSYAWTYTTGGPSSDGVHGVAVDRKGHVFVTGTFRETVDFDAGHGVDEFTVEGSDDPFVMMLYPDGTYGWTRQLGHPEGQSGRNVAVGEDGALYATGIYWTHDDVFDLDPGCQERLVHSHVDEASDTYITKLVCPVPTADFDRDGDVDLSDFARVQTCFTGDVLTECGDGCARLDFDGDDDIDAYDFAEVSFDITGP